MSRRTERLGHVIQREIGSYLLRDLARSPLGFLTVSRVDLTADLSQAKVLVSVFGDEAEKRRTLASLAQEAPRMRTHLAKTLQTRTVPRLLFEIDRNLDHGFRIAELLKTLPPEPTPPDRGTPGGAA